MLKEAVAANKYAKNIVWSVDLLRELGAYLVSSEFDMEPVNEVMRMNFFDEYDGIIEEIFYINYAWDHLYSYTPQYDKFRRQYNDYNEGDILSPVGYANIFTRYVFGEILNPNHENSKEEMKAVLDAYNEYYKEYEDIPVFIPSDRVPDTLPEPFFVPSAVRFTGYCYTELNSDAVEFVNFKLLFDFRLPYMDNKEYKGTGETSKPVLFSGMESFHIISANTGLAIIYGSHPCLL